MSTRTYGRNAYESTLNGALNNSATSFNITSATGLSDPLYLVIDPESPTKREYIRVGSISGSTFNSVTRGAAGSASGAQAHDSGTTVRAVFMHQMLDDIFTDVEALETADAAHFGGTDTADHPEATTSIRGFMSGADKTKLDALPSGATNDHDVLINVSIDDHHARDHAAAHAQSGVDELDVANLTSGGAADGQVAMADGAGGVAWEGIPGGITDHGALTGLADDDHSLYHTDGRADTWFTGKSASDLTDIVIASINTNELLQWNGSDWINRTLAEAGISGTSHTHTGSTISGLAAGDTTTGVFADARIPSLATSKITSGTFGIARIPTGTTSSTAALGNHGHSNLVAVGGDTMTGVLTMGAHSVRFSANTGLYYRTTNETEINSGGTLTAIFTSAKIGPGGDNAIGLGASGNRFTDVWAADGSINTSDPAQKKNMTPMPSVRGLLERIVPINFEWRDKPGLHWGFNADEIQAALPELVRGDIGHRGVRERDLIAILWQAVRELTLQPT